MISCKELKFIISFILLLLYLFLANIIKIHAGIYDNSVRFVAEQKGPLTLDPHTILQETNVNFYDNIYEGLINRDIEGNIIPSLAVSWKYVTETSIEFQLRKGVKFHNGEEFDSSSVKYSYDRFFNPELKSQAAGLFMYYINCEIIDKFTVRMNFEKPNGTFIAASKYIKILPEKYLNSVGMEYFEAYPVGTGPFKVIERKYNSSGVTNEINLVKL